MILGISLGAGPHLDCEHLVKYDGKKIEIAGLSFLGKFQLGSLNIEPTIIQAAGQSLMMLDASQYSLCQKVKGAPDDETRKKYYALMMDDQLRSQGIYRAIASLSLNPSSPALQDALKNLLLSNLTTSGQRAVDIERSDIQFAVERSPALPSENTLEIGDTSLGEKLTDLKKSLPELERPTPPPVTTIHPLREQCIKDIDNLTQHFDETTQGGTPEKIVKFISDELLPYVRSLYRGSKCAGIIGDLSKNLLRNLSISLDTSMQEYRKLSGLGTRQEEDLGVVIRLKVEEVLQATSGALV
jgi:hypothetical protein